MKTRAFFSQLDHGKMVAAIVDAERRTSGEILLFVSHRKVADAQRAAVREFERLGMHKTKRRNAVLIFVAPVSQQFAIIGEEAVHEKCGDAFWQRVAVGMAERFRRAEFTGGIVHGIEAAGKILAEHFPRSQGDANELPDKVIG
jgi:uncharacterized membrane protein